VKSSFTESNTSYLTNHPFGMGMPARSFYAGTGYSYGFNGKEQDDEVSGNGNQYDYGFRIYNPRIGKFLSVDPLFKSYAELTPYQFASNRPIDGIDLDGLEYITYIVTVENNTGVTKIEMIDYRNAEDFKNYEKYSQSFGPEGRGIKYKYNYVDENGNPTAPSREAWAQKQGGWNSANPNRYIYHGAFGGKGAVSFLGPLFPIDNGSGANTYKWDVKPNDMPDAIDREHDIEMDNEDYQTGDYKDPRYVGADLRLINRMKLYLEESSKEGYIDPFTNRAPSQEAQKAAKVAIWFFDNQIDVKIAEMYVRYKDGSITHQEFEEWNKMGEQIEKEKVSLPTN